MEIVIIILPVGLSIWTLVCVYLGFRMGRQSIDKPLAPIKVRREEPLLEEDPYYVAMNGKPQPRIQTAE